MKKYVKKSETTMKTWEGCIIPKSLKQRKEIWLLLNIQDSALFFGPYLNVSKCVILTMLYTKGKIFLISPIEACVQRTLQ